MGSLLRRVLNTFFALIFAVFSVNLTGVMTLQNAYATPGGGNQPCPTGTTELAKYEWNGGDNAYDAESGSSNVSVTGNATNGTFSVLQPHMTVSAVVVKGSNTSKVTNYNNVTNGNFDNTSLVNGGGQQPDISNVKICGSNQAPEFVDECGTANDKIVLPDAPTGFYHTINNEWWNPITNGGEIAGSGTDTVRYYDNKADWNIFDDELLETWSYTFDSENCDTEIPTVAAPTRNDECSTENDGYIIPALATGVEKYQVNINGGGWQDTTPGDHDFTATGEVKIRAVAANGYSITGQSEWTFEFDNDQCPVFVEPVGPTHLDPCGTADDKLFIPSGNDMGYKYQVNGQDIPAGENPGSGVMNVTAVPLFDYINLTGQTQWQFTFTNVTCVTPAEPTLLDKCGDDKDKFVIPSTEGVVYMVDGQVVDAGKHLTDSDVVVTAHALNANYELVGQTEWTLDFSQDLCPAVATEPTLYDICGSFSDYYTIPAIEGVRYRVSNTGNPGTFLTVDDGNHWNAGTFYVKAVAKNGYELTGQTEWTLYLNPSLCKVTANVDKVDECGSENDSYTIPTTDHVTYKKFVGFWFIIPQFETITAGDYDGSGFVWIVADPDPGYSIDGQSHWLFFFNSNDCDTTGQVTGIDPSADLCGINDDVFEITAVTGVEYKVSVNGGTPTDIVHGTHYVASLAGNYGGSTAEIEVTAHALPNYTYVGQDTWTHTFTDSDCATAVGLCEAGQGGVMVTINNFKTVDSWAAISTDGGLNWTQHDLPANGSIQVLVPAVDFKADIKVMAADETIILQESFDCTPGRGSIPPQDPPIVTPTGIELPKTGGNGANPITAIATILLSALAAYGATFYLVNRRDLAKK